MRFISWKQGTIMSMYVSRRSGEERRKLNDPNYNGPERRSGKDRRSGKNRRKSKFWSSFMNGQYFVDAAYSYMMRFRTEGLSVKAASIFPGDCLRSLPLYQALWVVSRIGSMPIRTHPFRRLKAESLPLAINSSRREVLRKSNRWFRYSTCISMSHHPFWSHVIIFRCWDVYNLRITTIELIVKKDYRRDIELSRCVFIDKERLIKRIAANSL